MKKIETIWHHILYSALAEKQFKHTQEALATDFDYSLSTIHHALKIPTQIGAIRKESKFFVLENTLKLLYYWASVRNLGKDIFYRTWVEAPVSEIEGLVPPHSIYAGYSAAKKILIESPADYTAVYFYSDHQSEESVRKRFPPRTAQPPNVFALHETPPMRRYGSVTTIAQCPWVFFQRAIHHQEAPSGHE